MLSQILADRGLVIVGLSLGNSYFKKETIDQILRFTAQNFSQTKIMIPDKPAEHNYRARGYDKADVERKARLGGNTLENHDERNINQTIDETLTVDLQLRGWEKQIETHPAYQNEYQALLPLYQSNG